MGKALGIVALILGIAGISLSWLGIIPSFIYSGVGYLPIPILLIAIICGAIGIKKDDSPGMAIAGLVLGSIGIFISIICVIIGNIRL